MNIPRARMKWSLTILLVITTILAIGTAAFFTDRVTEQMKLTTSTFTKDGYTLARTAPTGPFVAGEDVTFTLKESNAKNEDITSMVTITVKWDSPDKTCSIFGNQNAQDNAKITIGDETISYTLNTDGTITFEVPEHVLTKGTNEQETAVTLHIPESLQSTGAIGFTFDKVIVGQYPDGLTTEYDRNDLNASEQLDFLVKVGWAAGDPSKADGKAIMGYLTEPDAGGQYGIDFEMAFGYERSPMKDFTSAAETPWTPYKDKINALNFCEGMTTIGDNAFAGLTGVTEIIIPSTVTGIGLSAFDGAGLIDTITIPKNVTTIESLAFGNLPNVDTFIFEHGANDTLILPDNTSSGNEDNGAFALPRDFVETTVITDKLDIKDGYNWFNDNRRGIPVLAAQDSWYKHFVGMGAITSITIKDIYEPSSYAYSWDASDSSYYPGTVTAYLEETNSGSGEYKLTLAGNGYGRVIANADSSHVFQGFGSMTDFIGADILSLSGVPARGIPATTTLEGMFINCFLLQNIDLSSWDVSNVTTTSRMFMDCNALKTLDLSAWETARLKDTSFMFGHKAEGKPAMLETIDLTGWNTSKITDMQGMFFGGTSLTEIKGLIDFNTARVTNMNKMFMGCYSLPSIDVSGFDTAAVTDMASMFQHCRGLTALDISSFNTTGITDKSNLNRFAYDCTSLTTITLGEDFGQTGMLPSEGSDVGMFYVADYLKTTINGANDVMKVGVYDWVTEHRWKIGILDATLEYDDVRVGDTVDPQLGIDPDDYDEAQSIKYEVVDGYEEYISVDEHTGVVTGLKEGDAKVKVTIIDANGKEITAIGDVKVINNKSAFAVFSADDGSLTFYYRTDVPATDGTGTIDGKTATAVYTGFDTETYTKAASVPWYSNMTNILNVSFKEEFAAVQPVSTAYWFDGAQYMTTFDGTNLTTNAVTTMKYMFTDCFLATTIDVSGFDTTSVKDMSYMFDCCMVVTVLDVSGFNTANVTDMRHMFSDCYKVEALDVSGFNTAKVTRMEYMFSGCRVVTELDVTGFNTAKVTQIQAMFQDCRSIEALDVTGFNTAKVTNMWEMFDDCEILKSLDVSGFETKSCTDMRHMFRGCKSLETLDVSGFNTKNVKNMRQMFSNCEVLTTIDVSGFDTTLVTDMYEMFNDCGAVPVLDVSNFYTARVTTMNGMFSGCSALTTLDLSSFDTAKVEDMRYMFYKCEELTTIYASDLWSTASVTRSTSMFSGSTKLAGDVAYAVVSVSDATYAKTSGGYLTYKAANGTEASTLSPDAEDGTITGFTVSPLIEATETAIQDAAEDLVEGEESEVPGEETTEPSVNDTEAKTEPQDPVQPKTEPEALSVSEPEPSVEEVQPSGVLTSDEAPTQDTLNPVNAQ